MPLTLVATEGVLPKGQEGVAMARLGEAMLKWHGLTGNKVMAPNVIGTYQVLAKDQTFSGMQATAVVMIEWKVPSFAFSDRKVQLGYFEEATNIIHEICPAVASQRTESSSTWSTRSTARGTGKARP